MLGELNLKAEQGQNCHMDYQPFRIYASTFDLQCFSVPCRHLMNHYCNLQQMHIHFNRNKPPVGPEGALHLVGLGP